MPMFWVNGKQSETIELTDRSFQYGDGCFTTMLTVDGDIENWPLHIERMQACLDLLGITTPDWHQIKNWLDNAAQASHYAGLKLHISRGSGGRGYNPAGVVLPTVTISNFPFPEHYHQWREQGVELGVCGRKMGLNPLLASHKHNNRLEQVLLRAEIEELGYQDGVVCDINDHVIETTMANLFWAKGQTLYTPNLEMCGVAGVIRRTVIQEAQALGLTVLIGEFKLDHLDSADEVFMTNSVLGVAPVIKIGQTEFSMGSVTRQFQENLNS